MRKETAEAVELYNFLKANPEIAKKLAEESPEQNDKVTNIVNPEIRAMQIQLSSIEIDAALNSIKSRDKDVDEMAVLEIANKEHITVEAAYDMWRGRNVDKILEKKLKEQSTNITNKIKSNKNSKSLINSKTKPIDNFGLSAQEIEMAGKLDMSTEDYAKWKRK